MGDFTLYFLAYDDEGVSPGEKSGVFARQGEALPFVVSKMLTNLFQVFLN